MPNSTSSLLVLDSVWEGPLSPLYFLLAVTLYFLTVAVNLLLMAVIVRRPSLHAPMFLFLCSLFLNGVVGVSSLLPFLWAPLLSPTHTLSLGACSMQMFLIYTFSSVEIFNLAALAFDRYSAICFPLTYVQRVTTQTVQRALLLVWGAGLAVGIFVALLVYMVSFCRTRLEKIYCNYFDLSTLVCAEDLYIVFYIQVIELLYMCTVLLGNILFILYTYARILMVCFHGNKATRHKALSTCGPHLCSLLNYGLALFLEESQSKLQLRSLNRGFQLLLSVYLVVGPPICNAALYGLHISPLRRACWDLLRRRR